MTEVIQTRIEGGVFEVTLDRPKANAIDLATSRKMGDVFQSFRDDESLRVCILRTAGEKFFSAGWDLKAAAAGDSVTADYGVGGFGGLQELRDLNKPVIIIQGRVDMVCPPVTAFELAANLPNSDLRLIETGGHSGSQSVIAEALRIASDEFRQLLKI